MMRESPGLIYGFGWSIVLAGIATFVLGSILAKYLAKMVGVPLRILLPIIVTLSLLGSYAIRNNIFDLYSMVGLGIFVYLLNKLGFHPGPIGLGLILGPIVERALVQSMALTAATDIPTVFVRRPISSVLILMVIASIALALLSNYRENKERRLLPPPEKTDDIVGPTINESLVVAIVLGAIATAFYFRTGEFVGTGARRMDWLLPLILVRIIALSAVVMAIRAVIGKGERKISLIPPIFRGQGWDVTIVFSIVLACVLAIRTVGFWLSVLLMTLSVSAYLTYERRGRDYVTGLLSVAAVVLVLQYVMWNVFYIPVPRTFFLR